MKITIFTLLCLFTLTFMSYHTAKAQCAAGFNVYADTSLGAPLHTYLGNNTCQGANFLGIDTINYSYTWTWGDGTSTTAPFPSHTYATAGNYTICLFMNALNPAGCNDSICINATINKNVAMYSINIINPFAVVAATNDVSNNPFSIYPNPASDKIYIKGLQAANYQLAVYSLEGKLVATPSVEQNQYISIASLAKGNYILKITSSTNQSNVLKFFKD